MKRKNRRLKKGFTLVELLIAAAIITFVAFLIIPRMVGQVKKAKETEAVRTLGAIRSAEHVIHGVLGKFLAAADETAIKSALGLLIEGNKFYNYKIINASEEDFLALATPIESLNNWLQEFGINKDGFVNYPSSDGGGRSSGSGGNGGKNDSGGGGIGFGGGTISGGGGREMRPDFVLTPPPSLPSFDGYTDDIEQVLDILATSTAALSIPGMVSGTHLADFIRSNNVAVSFGDAGAGNWGVCYGTVPSTIVLSTELQSNQYAAAYVLAHETKHAVWQDDWSKHKLFPYPSLQYGVPNDLLGNERSGDSLNGTIDDEYTAFATAAQIWMDLKKPPNQVFDASGLGDRVDGQASPFANDDGTLKDSAAAKVKVREWYAQYNLPEY